MSTQSSERNNMDSKQEFKLFPNLPMELRKMIWHFTLEPRLPWRIESVPGGYVIKRYGILDVVVPQMKNLEEIYNVQIPTNEMEDDVPSGQGPMQLFDKLPKGLLEKGYGYDYVSDSLVEDPPRGLFDLAGVKVIEVWGWCPTKEWLKHGYVKDI
ncbi:hypothetical protein HYALB_00004574 [Hymenoscyphus albidus]|uniref:2EXR domain-containing protein n=1 Tax=Hymenoscyphus albidus TaxID=595503 RepID=A0A9N9QD47_9HELO|nr:hypothetical protein HYALB_00004574 [Hymenoscyphus albidus]